jgi:E3 ubiquitin-protein ligase DOA10
MKSENANQNHWSSVKTRPHHVHDQQQDQRSREASVDDFDKIAEFVVDLRCLREVDRMTACKNQIQRHESRLNRQSRKEKLRTKEKQAQKEINAEQADERSFQNVVDAFVYHEPVDSQKC